MAFEILNRPDKLPSDVVAFLVEFVHYFRHSAMWKFCYHVFFFGKQKQISNGKRGYDDALRVEYHLAPGMCEFSTPRRVTGFYDWHLAATSYRKAWRINIGHTIYINNGRMFMIFPGVLQHVCVCVWGSASGFRFLRISWTQSLIQNKDWALRFAACEFQREVWSLNFMAQARLHFFLYGGKHTQTEIRCYVDRRSSQIFPEKSDI